MSTTLISSLLLSTIASVCVADVTNLCLSLHGPAREISISRDSLSWEHSEQYCRDEHKGSLVQLAAGETEQPCVEQILNNATDLAEGVSFWTGARFDCPCLGAAEHNGTYVEYGSCDSRKSFICQYQGICPNLISNRCATVGENLCTCIYSNANDVEPTWAEAEEHCRNIGGKLAEVTSQLPEEMVALLGNSGKYWIGLPATERYSFYDTHGRGSWCESVLLDPQDSLLYEIHSCQIQKQAMCSRPIPIDMDGILLTTQFSVVEPNKQNSAPGMEQTLPIGIIAVIIVVLAVVLIIVAIFFITYYCRRKQAKQDQKGSVPYDGITFVAYDDPKNKTSKSESNKKTGSSIYSNVSFPPGLIIKQLTTPSSKKSKRKSHKSQNKPPDVIANSVEKDSYDSDTDRDLTLPSNIPTLEVAQVVVNMGLNGNNDWRVKKKGKLKSDASMATTGGDDLKVNHTLDGDLSASEKGLGRDQSNLKNGIKEGKTHEYANVQLAPHLVAHNYDEEQRLASGPYDNNGFNNDSTLWL